MKGLIKSNNKGVNIITDGLIIGEFKEAPKYIYRDNKKVKITFKEYESYCADGCCFDYGTITKVNGETLDCHNQDTETIVKGILEKLGYEVEIESIYED
jgi:hypothetical protein